MPSYDEILRERLLTLRRNKRARDAGEPVEESLSTGLEAFDRFGGIDRGVLTVIGGATGVGKSVFRQYLQEHTAKAGLTCLDLSFEDPPQRTADRTYANLTGLNSAKIDRADDLMLQRLRTAYDSTKEWAHRIEYHHGLKTPEECLEIIAASKADLIQADYLQAFPEGERGLERVISDFAWQLGADAQRNKRAVVVYSQLRSEVDQRGMRILEAGRRRGVVDISGFRPIGAVDLAWSSALGQRAKGLGFLFRPGRLRRQFGEADPDKVLELIWPKRNFGAEGVVVVGFDAKTAKLYNLSEGDKSASKY